MLQFLTGVVRGGFLRNFPVFWKAKLVTENALAHLKAGVIKFSGFSDMISNSSFWEKKLTQQCYIVGIYASVVRCRAKCVEKLSKVNGHHIDNFLASYFEYLHVCYYKRTSQKCNTYNVLSAQEQNAALSDCR